MKIKKRPWLRSVIVATFSVALYIVFQCGTTLGGGGGSNDKCKGLKTAPAKLWLIQGNMSAKNIKNRMTNFKYVIKPTPNLFNGLYKSIPKLTSSTGVGNYCKVVIYTKCKSYGENGKITYLWDGGKDHIMDVIVPVGQEYRIKVVFYEPCGYFYTGSKPVKRAYWEYDKIFPVFLNDILINSWKFQDVEDC